MALSHRRLSAWYHQLARQLEAGLPFASAIRSSRGTGLPAAALDAIAAQVENGAAVALAFETARNYLPIADRMVLAAAAEAGRMPTVLHSLSARHDQLGRAKLRLALACVYPIAMLHVGLLLLPLIRMIDWEKGFAWSTSAYIQSLVAGLGFLWLTIAVIWILARRRDPMLLLMARALPFVGRYIRTQRVADFAFVLGNFLEAGVRIDRAWANAGAVIDGSEFHRAAAAIQEAITRGQPPSAHLAAWPCFPPDFVAVYHTGETSGHLEQALLRISGDYAERANRALTLATGFYPGMMFLIVAGLVVFHVIKFYAGYLKMIEKLAS